VINVFVCPTRESGPTPVGASVEGYQMLRWSANGLTYWAVSDASDATLRKLMNCLTRNG
jgi:anti-sigma factor RsiW